MTNQKAMQTPDRATVAAIKRIIRNASSGEYAGLFWAGERWNVCDGFRLLRLRHDMPDLPHVENDLNTTFLLRHVGPTDEELPLPSVADLKAFIAAEKAKHGRLAKTPYLLGDFILVNPQYLLDVIQALPGCRAYKPATPLSPIYFCTEDGDDGILMPIRPGKPKKSSRARKGQEERR